MTTESEFRDWVRGHWMGWIDGREPRGRGSRAGWGSGTGAPDLQVGVDRGYILPIELKLGEIRKERLVVNDLHEPQRKWHARAGAAGVITATMAGVYVSMHCWRPFIMRLGPSVKYLTEVLELPQEPRGFTRGICAWFDAQRDERVESMLFSGR